MNYADDLEAALDIISSWAQKIDSPNFWEFIADLAESNPTYSETPSGGWTLVRVVAHGDDADQPVEPPT